MNKSYQPNKIEQSIYQHWEEQGYFQASVQNTNRAKTGKPYSIVIPPPNVTGNLHMGHGFQYVIMDALIRYHRMLGDDTLWQVGTDHAGIATQMVVENQLTQEGKNRHDMSREDFIERVWEWKQQYGDHITKQMRRLGASIDWQRQRFSMDEGFNQLVRRVFIQLYREKLIYRGKRLVNWDPHFKTALSDLEVVNHEEKGSLWYLRYPIANSAETLIIATTRPETMLGDVAVAVHPDDQRYQHLIGKMITLPLSHREIPIIADDYVDPTFASGCVKITPAHDFNDYEIGKRHQLTMINILTDDGCINDQAPAAYRGLERFVAREKIIAALKAQGLLEKIEDHMLSVPRNDRGNHIVEPYLTDQWYVSTESLAESALEAVKQDKTRFAPENWTKTYNQWLENIEDWCISRQLWWGHRIPAWYDQDGNVYVGEDELDVRDAYQLDQSIRLRQDDDVLDTWFSASLWPFVTLGWESEPETFQHFYPTSVLVTGFDIIFFWVARMMMMSLKFTGEVPFKEIYITGLIRDHEGQKMSKTKGNVLDPIDLIDGIDLESLLKKRTQSLIQTSKKKQIEQATREQFPQGIEASGTDALRFTYLILASTGRDIRFDTSRLQGYRNFCNKLWNAARFVLMHCDDKQYDSNIDSATLNISNQWLLSTLQQTIDKAHQYFKEYRFDLLAQLLYDFSWREYCDWYVECAKVSLVNETAQQQTKQVLLVSLESLLRLLHPLIPFITETIWQSVAPLLGNNDDTIMLQPYPQADQTLINTDAETTLAWIKQFITAIRNLRGEMNISPGKKLSLQLSKGSDSDHRTITENETLLKQLAKIEKIEWTTKQSDGSAAKIFLNELEIRIAMSGLINKDEEVKRLQKEISKQEKDYQFLSKKLDNPSFVNKAPAAVVAKDQQRCQQLKETLDKLKAQLTTVETL